MITPTTSSPLCAMCSCSTYKVRYRIWFFAEPEELGEMMMMTLFSPLFFFLIIPLYIFFFFFFQGDLWGGLPRPRATRCRAGGDDDDDPLFSLVFFCNNSSLYFKEICGAAYRGLVQPDAEDKRIISAQWAKDEDISRFLKSLPNWRTLATTSNSNEESLEDIEKRNTKETEILVQNLGSSDIPAHEILSDPNQLRWGAERGGGCVL